MTELAVKASDLLTTVQLATERFNEGEPWYDYTQTVKSWLVLHLDESDVVLNEEVTLRYVMLRRELGLNI